MFYTEFKGSKENGAQPDITAFFAKKMVSIDRFKNFMNKVIILCLEAL